MSLRHGQMGRFRGFSPVAIDPLGASGFRLGTIVVQRNY